MNKFKPTMKICLTFFIIFVLVFQVTSRSLEALESENEPFQEINLTSSVGIVINDTNIASYSSNPGATGAIDDPFIIEDLHIDTTDGNAFYIDHVSYYFEVRDSSFKGSTYGVWDSSSSFGKAHYYNCTIEGALSIGGSNVHGLTIDNCTLKHGQGTDFRGGTIFTNNVVYTQGTYLMSISQSDNYVGNNVFYGNNSYVRNMRAENSTIEDNIFYNSSFYIYDDDLDDMLSNTYSNNIINGKPFGFLYDISDTTITDEYGQIYLFNSNNVEISNADFNNVYMGIQVFNCSNLLIESVTVNGHKGIELEFGDNVIIKDSTFYTDSTGLYFSNIENLIVQNNYIDSYDYGFEFYNLVNFKITNNTIWNLGEYGAYLENGVECIFRFNIIVSRIIDAGNQMPIYLWDYYNSSIYYNVFIGLQNLTGNLAYEDSSDNVTWYDPVLEIGNFWSNWNLTGGYDIEGDGNIDLYPIIDFDGDTINESFEVLTYHTDPFSSDSDGDGLDDNEELYIYGTDPIDDDGDNDGLSDGDEILQYESDPFDNDTDSDGLEDGEEVFVYFTSPTNNDTDSDGWSDFDEIESGTDPLNASSFPIIEPPSNPNYLGLILGLTGGFLVAAGVTVFVLIKKGIIKIPKINK